MLNELLIEISRVNGLLKSAGTARAQILGVVERSATPVADIARTLGFARQSVQQMTDALEREGLVESKPNPNHARAKLINITAKGRKTLRQIERHHEAWEAQLDAKAVQKSVKTLRELAAVLER